jgi:hypothetical protein
MISLIILVDALVVAVFGGNNLRVLLKSSPSLFCLKCIRKEKKHSPLMDSKHIPFLWINWTNFFRNIFAHRLNMNDPNILTS